MDGGSTTHDGTSTTAAYTKWQDNSRIALGSGKDLQLYHNSNDSYINNTGTGDLRIVSSATKIYDADMSHFQATFTDGGSVDLYQGGNLKFQTIIFLIQCILNLKNRLTL